MATILQAKMNVKHIVGQAAMSSEFTVGLVALKMPIAENGPVAAATALVEFEEELPAYSPLTNARVFRAAEKVFRNRRRIADPSVEVKESFISKGNLQVIDLDSTPPDGVSDGAKVWLSAA